MNTLDEATIEAVSKMPLSYTGLRRKLWVPKYLIKHYERNPKCKQSMYKLAYLMNITGEYYAKVQKDTTRTI